MTRDPVLALEWLSRFEGAGLDGVIVKPEHGIYQPGKARDDQGEACTHGRLASSPGFGGTRTERTCS
jgi:hypothetical protein